MSNRQKREANESSTKEMKTQHVGKKVHLN